MVHPFPSILDGAAVAALALVAGGSLVVALAAAVAMTSLQFGIGAANDALDAERDRLFQPSKPIPAGLLARRTAQVVALGAASFGLAVSALLGPPELLVAGAGLAAGLAYDLGLKRTALAWLPFAVGLPLLVVFAWLAARDALPPALPSLVALGFLAGMAVALANGLVDLEADRAAHGHGVVTRLGRHRALVLLAVVDAALVAASWAVVGGWMDPGGTVERPSPGGLSLSGWVAPSLVVLGMAAIAAGWLLSTRGGRRPREVGWEAQAVGIALLGTAWLAAVS